MLATLHAVTECAPGAHQPAVYHAPGRNRKHWQPSLPALSQDKMRALQTVLRSSLDRCRQIRQRQRAP
eukprot:8472270-Pyramimonas_sp.AAC.1